MDTVKYIDSNNDLMSLYLQLTSTGCTTYSTHDCNSDTTGFPLAYVGDVVGTGSSRKSATNR